MRFIDFLVEEMPLPQRAAALQFRAGSQMARAQKQTAISGDAPTKAIDVQIASLMEKVARLRKKRNDILRRQQMDQEQTDAGGSQDQGMAA